MSLIKKEWEEKKKFHNEKKAKRQNRNKKLFILYK